MKKEYKVGLTAIVFVVLLFLTSAVYACPPSTPATLYIKQVHVSSDDFTFLNSNLEEVNYSYKKFPLGFHPYFKFLDSPSYLTVSIDNEEIFSSHISTLKTEVRRFYHNSQEWRNVSVYRFPNSEVYEYIGYNKYEFESGTNLSKSFILEEFNNSNLKIYLDSKLVREFSLGYEPPHTYHCGPTQAERQLNQVLIFIGVIALIAIVFAISWFIWKKTEKSRVVTVKKTEQRLRTTDSWLKERIQKFSPLKTEILLSIILMIATILMLAPAFVVVVTFFVMFPNIMAFFYLFITIIIILVFAVPLILLINKLLGYTKIKRRMLYLAWTAILLLILSGFLTFLIIGYPFS